MLIGPWIETLEKNIYSLSPLLRGYAVASLDEASLEEYYMILCLVWYKRKKMTPVDINIAMLSAIKAKFDPLIGKLCNIIFTTESDDFKNIAKELIIIPHLYIKTDSQLTGIHPLTKFLFRYFQLKITESNEDWTLYSDIYFQTQNEIMVLDKDSLEYKTSLWMFYTDTIIRLENQIPIKLKILQAITIALMTLKNDFTKIQITMNLDRSEISQLFWFAASQISNMEDLEFLITELNKNSNIINSFFEGFKNTPDDLSLMIDRVWLNESKKMPPDWNNCLRVFNDVLAFANKNKNDWLLAGATRGIMIIQDEYLNNKIDAIKAAEKGRILLGKTHPIIDLQEANIHFRSNEYNSVIEALNTVESSLPLKKLAILRVYGLRKAIRCSGELKDWDKASYFAERGYKTSQYIEIDDMRSLTKIAFKAELAWINYEKGNYIDSAKQFKAVLYEMENFANPDYPLYYIFHLRLGHALGWLSSIWTLNGSSLVLRTLLDRPFAGMFANFDEPPDDTKNNELQAFPLLWANLAKYTASFADPSFIGSFVKNALADIDGKQFILALTNAYHANHLNSLVNMKFERAIEYGLNYAKTMAILQIFRSTIVEKLNFREPWNLNEYTDTHDNDFYNIWFDSLINFILNPMTMYVCSLSEKPFLDFKKYRKRLINTFGKRHDCENYLQWMEKAILSAFGDEEKIELVKREAYDSSKYSENTRFIIMSAMSVSSNIQLSETMSFQFSMLQYITTPILENSLWTIFFYAIIKKRWTYFADKQKFMMSSPTYWSSKIIQAISESKPTTSDIARLLILIGEATSTHWPQKMLYELKMYEMGRN
jgi:hypothetical protein